MFQSTSFEVLCQNTMHQKEPKSLGMHHRVEDVQHEKILSQWIITRSCLALQESEKG